MVELLKNLLRIDEDNFKFKEHSRPIPSVIQYKVYKEDKEVGEYSIEDRGQSIHIIGATINLEFRGQNATDQFLAFLTNKFRPIFLTVGSEQVAVDFWKKKGFIVLEKGEKGETTYMCKRVV